jgi:ParB family transcriptional regulator, chromosome partitioning protein
MERIVALQKTGLGRGLSALIPTPAEPVREEIKGTTNFEVDIGRIIPCPFQPRRTFDQTKLQELAASISAQGIVQPLVVRRKGERFELIAGERRWRAAMKAGLAQVPVVVREANDLEALQLALVENLQREDLNPIEEAAGYRRLQEEFHWSQDEMAEKVGKSRPAIANALRLLSLPVEVQQEVAVGALPVGQARALLGLQSEPVILAAYREVLAKSLSTRETENLVRNLKLGRRRRRDTPAVDPDLRSLTEELQRVLGTKVRVIANSKLGKGKIQIEYYTLPDLERIIDAIIRRPTAS